MLILSRRAEQQIVFPNLGVRLSILQVRGRIVKVGIEAPSNITVLRSEKLSWASMQEFDGLKSIVPGMAEPSLDAPDALEDEHRRRSELNMLQLKLDSIQYRIDRGEKIDTEMVIETLSANVAPRKPRFADGDSGFNHSASNASTVVPQTRLLVVEDSDNERGLMTYLLAS